MTTEELRLEIQVAVKDALKNLTATTDEVKRLAREAAAATPKADALKATMAGLERDLKTSAQAARLFGDEAGGLRERQAALKGAIVDLLNSGISPQTEQIKRLKAEYDEVSASAKKIEGENRVMSGSFMDLQGAVQSIAAVKIFTTVATGVLDAGEAAITTAGRYEMLRANFETLTGSTAAAAAEFESLRKFANVTPFSLEGTAAAAKQLQAAKTPIADLTTRLGQLGDISLGNQQKFDSMVGAFSKMNVKGKVDLEQMNVFLEAGVPILDELAHGYGTTSDAVFDMMTKGKVKTSDFTAAMERMTSQGGQFFGGMARGAQTWEGTLSTYKDSLDGVAASYGELLLPAAKAVVKALTSINNAISDSPLLQGALAGVLVTATILLGIWAAKMAAATAATWLHYAATMALNAAKAVGNPILIAGIAAVGLATAGYIAYAASQNKATAATEAATGSTRTASSVTNAARDVASKFATTLDAMSMADLRAAQAALQAAAAHALVALVREQAAAKLDVLEKEITKRMEELTKKAAAWKESWAKEYGKFQVGQSSDPYASIEYERGQKLAEADAAGIGKLNQKTIDEINTYYNVKRKELGDSIMKSEKERLAQLTETKIDDMGLQKAAELAAWKGTEEGKAAIAADWNKRIADTEIQEAKRAAAAKLEAARREFEEELALAAKNKNYLGYATKYAQEAVKDTEVGKISGLAGTASVSPVLLAIASLASFALSLDNVSALLNPISTILEGARPILEPFINNALLPLVNLLSQFGYVFGQVLAPFINIIAIDLRILAGIFSVTFLPVLKLVGAAFTWLNNTVIVPFGNSIIAVINAVIAGINWALGWLGVHIDYLSSLSMIESDSADTQAQINKKLKAISSEMDAVRKTFDDKKKDLEDAYSKNIESLKKLLELGAMSENAYDAAVGSANASYQSALDALNSQEEAQLQALQDIYDRLNAGINVYSQQGAAPTVEIDPFTGVKTFVSHVADAIGDAWDDLGDWLGWWDVGAVEMPHDQLGVVHKGETIIPRTFSEGLRRGDFALSKSGVGGTTVVYQTTVHVAGSVMAENDLADSISKRIDRRKARGYLESVK